MKEISLIGQATDDQIKQWKAKYPKGIYFVTHEVAVDGSAHIGYFKNPDRNDVNCALVKSSKDNPLDTAKELASLTFIGGSEIFLGDDADGLGMTEHMNKKMNGTKLKLVNL